MLAAVPIIGLAVVMTLGNSGNAVATGLGRVLY